MSHPILRSTLAMFLVTLLSIASATAQVRNGELLGGFDGDLCVVRRQILPHAAEKCGRQQVNLAV